MAYTDEEVKRVVDELEQIRSSAWDAAAEWLLADMERAVQRQKGDIPDRPVCIEHWLRGKGDEVA